MKHETGRLLLRFISAGVQPHPLRDISATVRFCEFRFPKWQGTLQHLEYLRAVRTCEAKKCYLLVFVCHRSPRAELGNPGPHRPPFVLTLWPGPPSYLPGRGREVAKGLGSRDCSDSRGDSNGHSGGECDGDSGSAGSM